MAKHNAAELHRRLSLVERTIRDVGWGPSIVRALAKQIGCKERQIFRYRASVLESIRLSTTYDSSDEARAEFLWRLSSHQAEAKKNLSFGPLSSLMNIEAEVRGIKHAPALPDGQVQVIIATMPAAPASEE